MAVLRTTSTQTPKQTQRKKMHSQCPLPRNPERWAWDSEVPVALAGKTQLWCVTSPGHFIGTSAVKVAETKAIKKNKRLFVWERYRETRLQTSEDIEKTDCHI